MVIGSLPNDQIVEVIRWLALMGLATIFARPFTQVVLVGTGASGSIIWVFSKLFAWLMVGWLPWLFASLHILAFGAAAWVGLIVLALSMRVFGPVQWHWPRFAVVEVGFIALFWFGLAMRVGWADLTGLEKFTDMGFLAAAIRTDFMPPEDVWFAGEVINYYYVGQAIVATWANLADVPAPHAYQLSMATLFALTGMGSWALVVWMTQPFGRRIAGILGGLATLLVLYAGNLHSVLYTLVRTMMPTTKPDFYYPDSTRFIGFDPDTADKAFTEFPAYGFAVGDLHAHVVALPLFLLGVALILCLMDQLSRLGNVRLGTVAAFGWIIGLAASVNSWDVACLGLLAIVAACVGLARSADGLWRGIDAIGATLVLVGAVAALTAGPFLASFDSFSNGVSLTVTRTPLWQLLTVYGHVMPALLLFAGLAFWQQMSGFAPSAIGLLAVAALIMIAVPEEVYIKDIYDTSHARANTMFKFSFRAQHLLILAAVAALAPLAAAGLCGTFAAIVVSAPLIATFAYTPHIFKPLSAIRSLDGWAYLKDERALIEVAMTLPLTKGEAIIEAPGGSFTETARVSAMTGLPAVIGWVGHQWLWRSGAQAASARAVEIDQFYTTAADQERCASLRRYNVRYVILGQVEARKYPDLDTAGIEALGVAVFSGAGGKIITIDPARCEQ